jgi:hypothetical protein
MVDVMARDTEGSGKQQRRPEKRGQKTIKHEKMDDELWDLAKRAAERQKVGVMHWVCEAIRTEAEEELGMKPPPQTRDALAQILDASAQVLVKLDAIERRLLEYKEPSGDLCLLRKLFSDEKRVE